MYALLLAGCGLFSGSPVPAAKSDMIGTWHGSSVSLRLDQQGNVNYERQKKVGHTEINAPVQQWRASEFDVGLGPIVTTFVIDDLPHQRDGHWMMTVDGVELVRVYPP